MRYLFLAVLLSISPLFGSLSKADTPENPSDGNQIAQPILADYVRAERTPGFSPITDVIDQHGNHLSQ